MKFILIKAGGKAEIIEEKADTMDYLKLKEYLEIDSPVTCVERKIQDEYYDLWIDDEGLLKEDRKISGVLVDVEDTGANEILVGNMAILRHDEEGNTIGLTDKDIKKIMLPINITNTDRYLRYLGEQEGKEIEIKYFDGVCKLAPHSEWLMYLL